MVALASAASVALTFATPLGLRIVLAPLRTTQSLALFRANIDEFHPVWTMPYELTLALATGMPAAWALWRTRRSTSLFDLGVWLMSLALLISAVRGLMFFGVVSVAVFQRCVLRAHAAASSLLPPLGAAAPACCACGLTLHGDARRRRRHLPLDQAVRSRWRNAARARARVRRLGRGGDRLHARATRRPVAC